MLQIFSLALLGAATTSSHQIFPSTCWVNKNPGGEARGSVAPRLLPKLLSLGVDVNAQWARRSGIALIGVGHVARVLVARLHQHVVEALVGR